MPERAKERTENRGVFSPGLFLHKRRLMIFIESLRNGKKKCMDEAFDWKQMSAEMSFCPSQADESGEWTDILRFP